MGVGEEGEREGERESEKERAREREKPQGGSIGGRHAEIDLLPVVRGTFDRKNTRSQT
jgi:hypothetical protein